MIDALKLPHTCRRVRGSVDDVSGVAFQLRKNSALLINRLERWCARVAVRQDPPVIDVHLFLLKRESQT